MTTKPEWLEKDYATAIKMAVALAMEKRADLAAIGQTAGNALQSLGGDAGSMLSSVLSNPHVRRALAGALIGGGLGGMADPGYDAQGQQQGRLGNMLRGGLMGGVIGGGSGIVKNYLEQYPPDIAALGHKAKDMIAATGETVVPAFEHLQNSIKSGDASDLINKAEGARRELGILGVNEKKLDPIMSGVRKGTTSAGKAIGQAKGLVPGVIEQAKSIPGAVNTAMQQGDAGNAAAQLDVLGLKGLNPWSQNFSLPTAAASIGTYGLARKLPGLMAHNEAASQALHESLQGNTMPHPTIPGVTMPQFEHHPTWNHAWQHEGAGGVMGKLKRQLMGPGHGWGPAAESALQTPAGKTRLAELLPAARKGIGRLAPGAMALATIPLALREWMGSGYRSGNQPIHQLAEAQQQLGGR